MKLKPIIITSTGLLAGSVSWFLIELYQYCINMVEFSDYSLGSAIGLAVVTLVLLKIEQMNFKN